MTTDKCSVEGCCGEATEDMFEKVSDMQKTKMFYDPFYDKPEVAHVRRAYMTGAKMFSLCRGHYIQYIAEKEGSEMFG